MRTFINKIRLYFAGNITLLFFTIISMPIDIYFGDMTIYESVPTRAWIIASKGLFGSYYEDARFKLVSRVGFPLSLAVDSILYCTMNVSLYITALLVCGNPLINATWAIAIVGLGALVVGPFVGASLDSVSLKNK